MEMNRVGRPANRDDSTRVPPWECSFFSWDNLIANGGSDNYGYDPDRKTVISGVSDGVPEVSLYPQDTGSSGNYGTVNIGPNGNSTRHLSDQIDHGVSAQDLVDLAQTGRTLDLDPVTGTTHLNGDTGISAGMKDNLAGIIGKARIIAIYTSISGNGNNAEYTICQYVGIRIMYVNFQGKNKQLIVQPAVVVVPGGRPGSDTSSPGVNTSAWLVR